ncbi:phosphoribosylamine--glycine ligase [Lunatibacter salilacus]|uniref:phosphoribosylamine--glycine ligase n=1 Tax=Lunatibacter salilacus TaxID=2483804 RepID=UPI00131A8E73|nr:phosphoribosylamine--glycine ligase [Lunatibacter salilacus]
MKILLIGSGGREHAFAWKITQSTHCEELYIAPGNAGTSTLGENVSIEVNDFEKLGSFCLKKAINLVVVGPEEPLVRGIRDYFEASDELKDILLVGPGRLGAQLEGSKDFSKQFMARHGIPTAAYQSFTKETLEEGLSYIRQQTLPIVLKADGLAAGKGVLICNDFDEACAEFEEMLLKGKFGTASQKVVIEEFLTGIELSVFVALDGSDYVILPEAKDYKRIGDNDSGPNTGGMGAVSPVPFADEAFMQKVRDNVVLPTLLGLRKDNIPYQGFIFIGLMNKAGDPYVIEYNVRMGDPETQAVLPRIKSDFVELLSSIATSTLCQYTLGINPFTAATVVMVAGGYPDAYEKGKHIQGLEESSQTESWVFHAGTSTDESGVVLTNGGRVLGITGKGEEMQDAISNAYARVNQIQWDGVYYRKDIGQDILQVIK